LRIRLSSATQARLALSGLTLTRPLTATSKLDSIASALRSRLLLLSTPPRIPLGGEDAARFSGVWRFIAGVDCTFVVFAAPDVVLTSLWPVCDGKYRLYARVWNIGE